MKRFATLLHREWMQHKFGWVVVLLVPLAIALLLLGVGQVQFNVNDREITTKFSEVPPVALALASMIGVATLTFLGAWATSMLQAPGLARRDQQDRSIEFWLSLPIGHVPSVAAPMIAHLLLFPAAALVIGLVSGKLVSVLLVSKFFGLGAWFSLPWGTVLAIEFALMLRVLLGLLLATLWLSPLILLTMVASAWLKRWGLPAVIAAFVVIGNVLDKLYGNSVVWDVMSELGTAAARSVIAAGPGSGLAFRSGVDPTEMLAAFPGVMWQDAMHAIAALANPLLAGALVVSAVCFGLLVLRRRQGA